MNSTYLQMLSTITESGELRLELRQQEMPKPTADQVLVRIEASPINPSDLGLMFGMADISAATSVGSGADTVLSAVVSPSAMRAMQPRVGQALPLGNEGAGTVVASGDSAAAKSLQGKTVAIAGGATYAQYRCLDAVACLPLADGCSAKDGASSFVNPMTVLAMIETMRLEGHSALVHTAAASNLGQMLNRICQAEGIDLVNIVRKEQQVTLLKNMGAKYVINSSAESFMTELTDAIHKTGATLGFDATGGGKLASNILTCMEAAAARTPGAYSVYGSQTGLSVWRTRHLNHDIEPRLWHGLGSWWLVVTEFSSPTGDGSRRSPACSSSQRTNHQFCKQLHR